MADKKPRQYQPRGYKIYIRVPETEGVTTDDDVRAFLNKVASLLSDKEKDIIVTPYKEDDPDVKAAVPRRRRPKPTPDGEGAAEPAAGAAAAGAGGASSPLYPAYVCHHK